MQAAREHRDGGWRLIQRRCIEGTDVPDQAVAELAWDAEIAETYERAVSRADLLADSRAREADRNARFANCSEQLEKIRADLEALQSR